MTNLSLLGLSEKEQQVFEAILQTGIVSVRELSQSLSLERSTIYLYLDELKQLGLIVEIMNEKRKYFQAVSPKGLRQIVHSKIDELEKLERELPLLVHQLQSHKKTKRGSAKLYKGVSGMRALVEEIAVSQEEVYFLGSIKGIHQFLNAELMETIYTKPRRRKMCVDYLIADWASSTVRRFFEESGMFTKIRFLPPDIESKGCFVAFGNKLVVAQYYPQPNGIVIDEPALIVMFKLAFSALWKELEGKNIPPKP